MIQHDKHQYYFEKYLRQEMSQEEVRAFESKLQEDAPLRLAFEYYRLNRSELLKDLIEEHKLKRRDNRLNQLFFLLISLTGIALVFNYYMYRKNGTSDQTKEQSVLVKYIPFLNWENRSDKKTNRSEVHSAETDSTAESALEEPPAPLEPSVNGDERLASDQFIRDTFIMVVDELAATRILHPDSVLADSTDKLIPPMVKSRPQKLLVEFWESPLQYKGYLFANQKLVIYGMSPEIPLVIFKNGEELKAAWPEKTILLTELPNFIPF